MSGCFVWHSPSFAKGPPHSSYPTPSPIPPPVPTDHCKLCLVCKTDRPSETHALQPLSKCARRAARDLEFVPNLAEAEALLGPAPCAADWLDMHRRLAARPAARLWPNALAHARCADAFTLLLGSLWSAAWLPSVGVAVALLHGRCVSPPKPLFKLSPSDVTPLGPCQVTLLIPEASQRLARPVLLPDPVSARVL